MTRRDLAHDVSVYREHVTGERGRSAAPSPAGRGTTRASLERREPTARGMLVTAHPPRGVRSDQMDQYLTIDRNHLRRDDEVRSIWTGPTLLA